MAMSDTSTRDKVVVALDGSPATASALPVARALASRLNCNLEVLRALPGSPAVTAAFRSPGADERTGKRARVRGDSLAAGILRTAADPAVALVVLTTHGGVVGTGPRLGRVAERVIAETTRPVLLVRPEAARHAVEALRAGHLLVPLDGAPATLRALGPVIDLASRLGVSLDALFVASGDEMLDDEPGTVTIPQFVDQPQHAWPEWQCEVVEHLGVCSGRSPLDVPARAYIAAGPVSPAILGFAQTHRDGMIALVRRSQLERGHGRILRETLARATCAVLVTGVAAKSNQQVRSWLAPPYPLRPHVLSQGA